MIEVLKPERPVERPKVVSHRQVGYGVDDLGNVSYVLFWSIQMVVPPGIMAYKTETYRLPRPDAEALHEELGAVLTATAAGPDPLAN